MKNKQPVIKYYRTFESRLGYRWLKGVKHFGYYPEGHEHIPKYDAQLLMNEQLAKMLSLPKGAKVLDAGCGEGGVALYLHDNHGYDIFGIDLLDFNIKRAKRRAQQSSVNADNFRVGSYMNLPFPDKMFDGLFTMETLVHAPDYKEALSEFYRILKPGGKLALFEYSLNTHETDEMGLQAIHQVNALSSMPAFNEFETGSFCQKLQAAGFTDCTEMDITPRIMPMLTKFYQRAQNPYRLIKKLGLENHFVNAMSAVVFYEHPSLWRYNIVTGKKK